MARRSNAYADLFGESSAIADLVAPERLERRAAVAQRTKPMEPGALMKRWQDRLRMSHKHCYWCGRPEIAKPLQRDHVVPKVKGGPELPWNGVLACSSCNQSKGDEWPSQWARFRLAERIQKQWPDKPWEWCEAHAEDRVRFAREIEGHFRQWLTEQQPLEDGA